jgi:predicted secreted protein
MTWRLLLRGRRFGLKKRPLGRSEFLIAALLATAFFAHGKQSATAQVETIHTVVDAARLVVLDETFSGIARISTRQQVNIRLKASLGAGFSWNLEGIGGDSVSYLGTKIESANAQQGGGVGGQMSYQVFSFAATKAGTVEIKFLYHRPWLKPTDTDRRISFHLDIQEGK